MSSVMYKYDNVKFTICFNAADDLIHILLKLRILEPYNTGVTRSTLKAFIRDFGNV